MTTRSISNIPALTSIRGIAAWWVVAYHFREYIPLGRFEVLRSVFAEGYLAVDLFFVLSGFVIFLNYADSFKRIGRSAIRQFLIIRLARIYPLHFVLMFLFVLNPIAILLFSNGGTIGGRYDPVYFVLSIVLIHNWGFMNYLAWNIPSWSISTEWFAYLCFPAVAYLINRCAPRIFLSLGLLLLALGLLALVFWLAGAAFIGDDITSLGLIRCVLEFVSGAFICDIYRRYKFASVLWSYFLLSAAVFLTVVSAQWQIPNYMTMPACFCLIIIGLVVPNVSLESVFRIAPLMYLGEISYSTYMVHYFVKDWVKLLLVKTSETQLLATIVYVLATLGASALLHRTVEVGGRRLVVFRLRPNS